MKNFFRPRHDPAQAIYDAFQSEATKRDGRSADEWMAAERNAVFHTAISVAERMGLIAPTMEDVVSAERSACGHADYGAKWAYGVVDAMHRAHNAQSNPPL